MSCIFYAVLCRRAFNHWSRATVRERDRDFSGTNRPCALTHRAIKSDHVPAIVSDWYMDIGTNISRMTELLVYLYSYFVTLWKNSCTWYFYRNCKTRYCSLPFIPPKCSRWQTEFAAYVLTTGRELLYHIRSPQTQFRPLILMFFFLLRFRL